MVGESNDDITRDTKEVLVQASLMARWVKGSQNDKMIKKTMVKPEIDMWSQNRRALPSDGETI